MMANKTSVGVVAACTHEIKAHRVSVPDLDDLFICGENHTITSHPASTLDPRNIFQWKSIPLIFDGKRSRGPYIIE